MTPEQVVRLATLAAALADRMEARSLPTDPDLRRQRQEKVDVLRRAAAAGQASLRVVQDAS